MAYSQFTVPNEPLRNAFIASGREGTSFALAIGFYYKRHNRNRTVQEGDKSRLERRLGLKAESAQGKRFFTKRIRLDTALLICDELGIEFNDIYPDYKIPNRTPEYPCRICGEPMIVNNYACGFCLEEAYNQLEKELAA